MKQKGFTLIELMVTIVIIAILAGIAVPQYLAYTRRAEVAEMVALADIVKKKVGIFYSTKGRWPDEDEGDTAEEVGLDLVLGAFGVSSENSPDCGDKCALLMAESEGTLVDARARQPEFSPTIIFYRAETSEAALTWSCTWHGEYEYPGAKPDGCKEPKS